MKHFPECLSERGFPPETVQSCCNEHPCDRPIGVQNSVQGVPPFYCRTTTFRSKFVTYRYHQYRTYCLGSSLTRPRVVSVGGDRDSPSLFAVPSSKLISDVRIAHLLEGVNHVHFWIRSCFRVAAILFVKGALQQAPRDFRRERARFFRPKNNVCSKT